MRTVGASFTETWFANKIYFRLTLPDSGGQDVLDSLRTTQSANTIPCGPVDLLVIALHGGTASSTP